MQQYMELLDLSSGWTRQDLEQAYQDQLRVWHPERFEQDSKLHQRAKKRIQQIHFAYERLKVVRDTNVERGNDRNLFEEFPVEPMTARPAPQPPPVSEPLIFNNEFGAGTIFENAAGRRVSRNRSARPLERALLFFVFAVSLAVVGLVFATGFSSGQAALQTGIANVVPQNEEATAKEVPKDPAPVKTPANVKSQASAKVKAAASKKPPAAPAVKTSTKSKTK